MSDRIPFEEKDVRLYLDRVITHWRNRRDMAIEDEKEEEEIVAKCYIDAFQSVRVSILGKLLPKPEDT